MVLLIENFLLLLFVLGLVFEVFIPILTGRTIFPHFRKSTWTEHSAARAAARLEQARIKLEAAQMEVEAMKLEEEAQQLTKPKGQNDAQL